MFNTIKDRLFKKKVTKKWLKEKKEELLRRHIVANYMKERIKEHDETNRRKDLSQMQTLIDELKRQIEFGEKL